MEIHYSEQLNKIGELYSLYEKLNWMSILKLNKNELRKAMENSLYVVYAYDKQKLVGTGRIISDAVINAYICGIGVLDEYRCNGIGTKITKELISYAKKRNLHVQLICEERLVPYYEKLGFEKLGYGMKMK